MLKLVALYVIILTTFSAHALTGENFEFHGYLRTGVGTNSKGADQSCFNNPGTSGNEFRLGNECTTYGELTFIGNHLKKKNSNDPFFKTQITLGYSTDGDTNWENVNAGSGFSLREAYIEAGNIENSQLSYWVGNRFYRDNDVYMNDFYYFADASANGGGVSNIPLGFSTLNLAYLKQTNSTDTDNGKISLSLFDMRLNGLKLSDKDELKFWFAFAKTSEGISTSDSLEYGDQKGYVASALYSHNFTSGFNHLALIYGKGVMENIHISFTPLEKSSAAKKLEDNKYRVRIVDHLTYKFSEQFEMHASATYELRDNGAVNNNKEVWYNLGAHPVYYFSKHKQLAGVIGYSSVDKDGQVDRRLFRATIAPQISLNNAIWARPVLRVFYTKTFWSTSNKGQVGGNAYANETSGSNFGVQAEVFY